MTPFGHPFGSPFGALVWVLLGTFSGTFVQSLGGSLKPFWGALVKGAAVLEHLREEQRVVGSCVYLSVHSAWQPPTSQPPRNDYSRGGSGASDLILDCKLTSFVC